MQLLSARGRLTRYGLACGYIERTETPYHFITLMMEGSTILVKVHDRTMQTTSQKSCRTVGSGYIEYNRLRRELIPPYDESTN